VGALPCDNWTFQNHDTFGVAMVTHVKDLPSLYNLLDKLIAYVKDEGDDMSTLTQALTSIIIYGPLRLVVL
jgi:hypothetical protein